MTLSGLDQSSTTAFIKSKSLLLYLSRSSLTFKPTGFLVQIQNVSSKNVIRPTSHLCPLTLWMLVKSHTQLKPELCNSVLYSFCHIGEFMLWWWAYRLSILACDTSVQIGLAVPPSPQERSPITSPQVAPHCISPSTHTGAATGLNCPACLLNHQKKLQHLYFKHYSFKAPPTQSFEIIIPAGEITYNWDLSIFVSCIHHPQGFMNRVHSAFYLPINLTFILLNTGKNYSKLPFCSWR